MSTPSSSSMARAGILRAVNWLCQITSLCCACLPIVLNSTLKKTSGNSCARTSSLGVSLTPTTTLLALVVMLGKLSSTKLAASNLSPLAIGYNRSVHRRIGIRPSYIRGGVLFFEYCRKNPYDALQLGPRNDTVFITRC